ncbi:unnamed protein product, partial [Didymodactylos carnosus]
MSYWKSSTGTGVFVFSGYVAAQFAGPSIILSFGIAGIAACLCGLSYAELSSMIPISGSAYTYTYTSLGEIFAWIVGWDLLLQYICAGATVSVGWSGYVVSLFQRLFNIEAIHAITRPPFRWNETTSSIVKTDGGINLPAICIVFVVTIILLIGVRESLRFNLVIVTIKLCVILLFTGVAFFYVKLDNYKPFIPPNQGTFNQFGVTGMLHASTILFFAYIGFDAVATAAQETKTPEKDVPRGILLSLLLSAVIYILVSIALIGVVCYKNLDVSYPLSLAMEMIGSDRLAVIVDLGIVLSLTGVILVNILAPSRILMTMAQDGLFMPFIAKLHPTFKTPYRATIITGKECSG